MWKRSELKERAKMVLKKTYWKAFLISIVIAIAGGNGSGNGGGGSGNTRGTRLNSIAPDIANSSFLSDAIFWVMIIIGALLFIAALRIFIGYHLEVGGRKYFIQSAQDKNNMKCFKFAFMRKNYLGIMFTMLLRGIQNLLWYLLLIIPGIVKSYSYSMVPYILADNPNIGSKRAIKISNDMTYGHKSDMFVLDLSFIGWYLLGMLALIVGMLFVMPYENATKAELYLVLRENALKNNICNYDELLLNNYEQNECIEE